MSAAVLMCHVSSLLRRRRVERVTKFLFVGAIGVAVQLAVLKALIGTGCPYLTATAIAVEAAVLQNFMWHQRLTWKDRAEVCRRSGAARLLRFHLSNGTISIMGTLLLMRLLVGRFRMNVLMANLLTIAVCSVANFYASDRWVFSHRISRKNRGDSLVWWPGFAPPEPQSPDALVCGLIRGSGLRAICHEKQRPLGKRNVDKGSGYGQGHADTDLRR